MLRFIMGYMGTALDERRERASAGPQAADVCTRPLRATKQMLAKRYRVGVRTIENWQYSGIILARFEKKRAVFDAVECDERLLNHPKRHHVR